MSVSKGHAASITLKMEAAWSCEMLVYCHITACCHNAEDHDLSLHHSKSQVLNHINIHKASVMFQIKEKLLRYIFLITYFLNGSNCCLRNLITF
jgi:hypothetical protein